MLASYHAEKLGVSRQDADMGAYETRDSYCRYVLELIDVIFTPGVGGDLRPVRLCRALTKNVGIAHRLGL